MLEVTTNFSRHRAHIPWSRLENWDTKEFCEGKFIPIMIPHAVYQCWFCENWMCAHANVCWFCKDSAFHVKQRAFERRVCLGMTCQEDIGWFSLQALRDEKGVCDLLALNIPIVSLCELIHSYRE